MTTDSAQRRIATGVGVLALALAAAGVAAATAPAGARPAARTAHRTAHPRLQCSPARIEHRPPPAWTASAWSSSSPGLRIPYALATPRTVAGFFFARGRLRAGHPTNPSNKVLWIVRLPRNGHPLTISARLSTEPSLLVRTRWPADSSPGEIYPSEVDLPKAGCWRLTLFWGTHRATLDVAVRSARRS